MRYDKDIYFQRRTQGAYDPETGDYGDATIDEDHKMANVIDTKKLTMEIVYGKIKQGSYTISIQNHYEKPFDYIRYGSRRYKVDYSRKLNTKHVFVVSEVQ